jgi:organic radical activating enzyme
MVQVSNTGVLVKKITKKTSLPIMEAFYTIQGEGLHQGKAAYFIRLAGCDVGCFWCDVKESWDEKIHPSQKISTIVNEAAKHPARLAVVTGGEPTMHNLTELTDTLHQEGFRTHIETSGTHPLTGNWDWVCFSPKRFKKPLEEIYPQTNELKIVISSLADFEWAEKFAQKMPKECNLFLQPEWSKSKKMLPIIVEYVKNNPKWNISLQVHKYMNIP